MVTVINANERHRCSFQRVNEADFAIIENPNNDGTYVLVYEDTAVVYVGTKAKAEKIKSAIVSAWKDEEAETIVDASEL